MANGLEPAGRHNDVRSHDCVEGADDSVEYPVTSPVLGVHIFGRGLEKTHALVAIPNVSFSVPARL